MRKQKTIEASERLLQKARDQVDAELLRLTVEEPCPRDTDGDGHCGVRHCIVCNPPDPDEVIEKRFAKQMPDLLNPKCPSWLIGIAVILLLLTILLTGCMDYQESHEYWLSTCCIETDYGLDCSGCYWNSGSTLRTGPAYHMVLQRVHLVKLGMTQAEVQRIIGIPFDTSEVQYSSGKSSVWFYGSYLDAFALENQVYISFTDGRVTSIEKH